MIDWKNPTDFIFTAMMSIDPDYKVEIIDRLKAQAVKSMDDSSVKQSSVNYSLCTARSLSKKWYTDDTYDFLIDMVTHAVKSHFGNNIEPTDNWLLIYKGDDETLPHNHIKVGSSKVDNLVAIYYISAPEGSGALYFPKRDFHVNPEDNLLVVHRADEIHGVRANTTPDIERICLVVNYNT